MIKIISIADGKAILELKLNGFGSYLKFTKPLAINWWDCRGSIGQYFAIFSYCNAYKDAIQVQLRESLNNGSFDLETGILEIEKLLSLFETGSYRLSFEPEYKYAMAERWEWDLVKNRQLFASNPIIRKEAQRLYTEDKAYIDYLTESYYEAGERFLFTQPSETLNEKRIYEYQELIQQGNKPVAIIYSGHSQSRGTYEDGSNWVATISSGNFILDGHHKLMAYKALNLPPALLRIDKIYQSNNELDFIKEDFETDIKTRLQHCQVKHILDNYKSWQ